MSFDSTIKYDLEESVYNAPEDFFENPDDELQSFILRLQENTSVFINATKLNETLPLDDSLKNLEELQNENLDKKEKLIELKKSRLLYDTEINILREKLTLALKEKEEMTKEIDSLITDFAHISEEANERRQKIKETYNAYNYAAKFYKKHLEIYLEVEHKDKLLVTVNYFTTNANNKQYSMRLLKDEAENKWELHGTTPEFPAEELERLQDELTKTNNLVPLVFTVKNNFQKMREGIITDNKNTG